VVCPWWGEMEGGLVWFKDEDVLAGEGMRGELWDRGLRRWKGYLVRGLSWLHGSRFFV